MSLADSFESLLVACESAFPQRRTFLQARRLAYGFLISWGRRTISRALCACHAQFQDWSASYRLFSRSPWEAPELFRPVLQHCLGLADPAGPFVIALDDTTLKKTGRRMPGVSYSRDPMSPPFHPNLRRGQRFIQASSLIRPEGLAAPARAIPIRFRPAPPPPKPGKKATPQALQAYRLAQRTQNLSCQGAALIQEIRDSIDQAGARDRTLLLAVDGSFCNRNVLRHLPQLTHVVGRARTDLNLFALPESPPPGVKGRRRKYGPPLPKPAAVRASDDFPWQQAEVFGAGRPHLARYKVLSPVLWRSGTRAMPLRLIIIAPLRYRRTAHSALLYRDPACLLTTDLVTPVQTILQAYFDRWEIEVNLRDEKSLLGVGHPQVWSAKAAARVPQFQVAVYAMLLLASLLALGPRRTAHYLPLPKWRRPQERRPSTLDILALLREELLQRAITTPLHSHSHAHTALKAKPLVGPTTHTAVQRSNSQHRTTATPPKTPADVVVAALYAFT